MPVDRLDEDDEVYRTNDEKLRAVVREIEEANAKMQPMLVGTTSIEKSEHLAEVLERRGYKKIDFTEPNAMTALYAAARVGKPSKNFAVLNARHHEQEAFIVAEAGVPGAITIATNMAGRGTDIQLGGNVEMRVKQELDPAASQEERDAKEAAIRAEVEAFKQKAIEAGGLYIIGTERHESRRIDNQLRGRSGRQGDPGRSKFYLSLQDDLMRIFGSERMDAMLKRLGLKDDEAIVHPWINKALEKAQQKVEARNFDIRKNILKFDNVMNDQRKVIFEDRRKMMAQESLEPTIADMRADVVDDLVTRHIPPDAYPEAWDVAGLKEEVAAKLNLDLPVDDWAKEEGIGDEEMAERLLKAADEAYAERVERNTPEAMRYVEKQVILQSLDHLWRDHLVTLDHLRQVIGWRGMAQRDPLNEYKSEAFELFQKLIVQWHEAVTAQMMRIEVRFQAPAPEPPPPMQFQHLDRARRRERGAARRARRAGRRQSILGRRGRRHCGGAGVRRRRRARPQQSGDLGQDRPQRALPLRFGQEVQALPRAVGLTSIGARRQAGRRRAPSSPRRSPASSTRRRAKRRCCCAPPASSRPTSSPPLTRRSARRPTRSTLRRRGARAGEPLSRILGRARVLEPRRSRSRPMCSTRARKRKRSSKRRSPPSPRAAAKPLRLLDLGVGSGALLCALLSELPAARGLGVDLSRRRGGAARANRRGARPRRRAPRSASAIGPTGLDGPFDLDRRQPALCPQRRHRRPGARSRATTIRVSRSTAAPTGSTPTARWRPRSPGCSRRRAGSFSKSAPARPTR